MRACSAGQSETSGINTSLCLSRQPSVGCHTAGAFTGAVEQVNFQQQVLLQVRAYSKVFWKRHKDINDWEKHIKNIEGGEARIQRQTDIMNAIASKMNRYKNPHQVGVACAN